MGQPGAVGVHVLGQGPGGGLVDILVGPELVHLGLHLAGQGQGDVLQLLVDGLRDTGGHDLAAKVLLIHGDGPVHQVAQDVGQLAVDPLDDQLIGHDAVVGEGDLVEHEVADGVHPEELHQVVGVDLATALVTVTGGHVLVGVVRIKQAQVGFLLLKK